MTEYAFPVAVTVRDDLTTVTAFNEDSENPIFTANSNHPHFAEIMDGLTRGRPDVWALFDVLGTVQTKFAEITDRVTWNGSRVLFDGAPVDSVLANQLERVILSGNSAGYVALAKFWEKLETNPSEHSKAQAYEWLASHAFQITDEGDVIAYKGVFANEDGSFTSSASSAVETLPSGYVNGQPTEPRQRISQRPGDVVSLPRNEVVHDPSVSCARGLHVGTNSYALHYGNTVVQVYVNPRDMVSVPNGEGEKMRVCRYRLIGLVDSPDLNSPVLEAQKQWVGNVGYDPAPV